MQYHLKVATLNFSGINVSPFEYHDGSEEKSIFDRTFKSIFEPNIRQNPKAWNIAKIDKVFQKERYTILYQPDCGCVRGKLLTKEQFEIVWDRTFDQNKSIVSHMNWSEQNINKLRTFDYMIYESYLSVIFGEVDMKRLDQYSALKYTDELKKWHSKGYLNQNTKINYVKQYILKQELDVLFLQQALTDRAKQYIPSDNYSFVFSEDSMIIFKKQTYFLHDYEGVDSFDQKYRDLLNFNNDSCYFKSKDILLLSIHLSSKSTNVQQAKQMFETLKQIHEENKQLKFIIGIDANHKISGNYPFNVYPETNVPTTRKKRTTLQCQFEKSNKLIQESKDFIITNIPMTSNRIQTIRSWEATHDLLPNDDHPFDHFLVSANLEFDKPTFRSRTNDFIKFFQNPIKRLIAQATKSNNETQQDILSYRVMPPQPQNHVYWRKIQTVSPFLVVRKSIHKPIPAHAINHIRGDRSPRSPIGSHNYLPLDDYQMLKYLRRNKRQNHSDWRD